MPPRRPPRAGRLDRAEDRLPVRVRHGRSRPREGRLRSDQAQARRDRRPEERPRRRRLPDQELRRRRHAGIPVRLRRRLPARRHADRLHLPERPGPADQGLLPRPEACRRAQGLPRLHRQDARADRRVRGRREEAGRPGDGVRDRAGQGLAGAGRAAHAGKPVPLRQRQGSGQGHPALQLGEVLRRPGRHRRQGLLAVAAEVLRRVRQAAGQGAGEPVAGLPALPHHRRRLALPDQGVRGQQVRLLRQDPGRPAGTEAAVEARAGHRQRRHGHGAGRALRQAGVHPGSQGARAGTGRPTCATR